MKQSKIKVIRHGEGEQDVFHVRAQGRRVRLQDISNTKLYLLDPPIARKLAAALCYAAKHSSVVPITPEMEKILNEMAQS